MAARLRRHLALWTLRRRGLARRLFGIDFGPLGPDDYYFDLSTVALVRHAARVLPRGVRLLDLGTGPHAVVGLALWRRIGAQVVAADLNPTLVALARENVARNRAPLRVLESRFFAALGEVPFDVVVVNPPYVPRATAEGLALPESRRSQWDGGLDGFDVVAGYVEALAALEREVLALVALNRWWIPPERFRAAVGREPRLRYQGVHRSLLLPIDIHSVRRPGPAAGLQAASESARGSTEARPGSRTRSSSGPPRSQGRRSDPPGGPP